MRQALQENRTDVERVRQFLLSDDSEPVPGKSGYLEQAKVVLPDLSKFDLLRMVGAGREIDDVQ